jgi:L-asparagine transporter-like permease
VLHVLILSINLSLCYRVTCLKLNYCFQHVTFVYVTEISNAYTLCLIVFFLINVASNKKKLKENRASFCNYRCIHCIKDAYHQYMYFVAAQGGNKYAVRCEDRLSCWLYFRYLYRQ